MLYFYGIAIVLVLVSMVVSSREPATAYFSYGTINHNIASEHKNATVDPEVTIDLITNDYIVDAPPIQRVVEEPQPDILEQSIREQYRIWKDNARLVDEIFQRKHSQQMRGAA